MNYRAAFLAIGLALASLPAFSQGFVSSENYSDNPMDRVGVAHNAYTRCLAVNYTGGGVAAHVENLVKRCGMPTDGDPAEFIKKHTEIAIATRTDPSLSLVESLRPYRDSFSEEQFSYFEDTDQILAAAATPEEADLGLKLLEAQAVKSLGRSDKDLAVLGAISTARYSLELWTQDNPIIGTTQNRIPGWLQVVVADVTGFISGGGLATPVKAILNAIAQSIVAGIEAWGGKD